MNARQLKRSRPTVLYEERVPAPEIEPDKSGPDRLPRVLLSRDGSRFALFTRYQERAGRVADDALGVGARVIRSAVLCPRPLITNSPTSYTTRRSGISEEG
jgi:hypothetical protein